MSTYPKISPVTPKNCTPTPRQQRLAQIMVDKGNGFNSKRDMILAAGYSEAQALKAEPFGTAGYKQALRNLGLTEELITCSLKEDIEAKPKARLGELRLGAELLQMTEPAGDKGNVKVEISFIKREG